MLNGGCFCGAVRYATDGRPFHESVCYCVDCRRVVGSVAVAWFTVPRSSFRVTAGIPATFRSSPKVTRQFCGTCGTALTYAHDDLPDEVDVTTGSLDDPEATPPKDHLETSSRPTWVVLCDGLPVHPGGRTGP